MKKSLVLALTLIVSTIGLIGCGANDRKAEESKNNSQIEQQADNKEKEMVLAKVTKTVGNEVSVNLSKDNLDSVGG